MTRNGEEGYKGRDADLESRNSAGTLTIIQHVMNDKNMRHSVQLSCRSQ